MADDEFVIGFCDSEWTGIAPLLEEDVAMSSLAQDELGHAAGALRPARRARPATTATHSPTTARPRRTATAACSTTAAATGR